MKPSDTASGQAWLDNFSQGDLAAATVLLDSIRFVDLDTLRNRLVGTLENLLAAGKVGEPSLLLPERSLTDLTSDPDVNRQNAVAYENVHPGSDLSVTPGSEGFIGGLLRDFAAAGERSSTSPWIAPDADIEHLRNRRCRTIVLVTDYSGSGSQLITLAETLIRNKTIRSWRSLKLIQIHVLAFAVSLPALKRLESSKIIDAVHTVEPAPTFDTAGWTDEVHEAIVELCERESRAPHWSLGYRRSAGLFATARGAPNNLPAILWYRAADWNPLFPKRKVPPAVASELGGYAPTEPLPELAARVGQMRVGQNERLEYMRPRSRELLGALLSLREARKEPLALAADLHVSTEHAEALLKTLKGFGFVAPDGQVTHAGRYEIRAQKRALRRTTADLRGSDDPYYPHALSEGEART